MKTISFLNYLCIVSSFVWKNIFLQLFDLGVKSWNDSTFDTIILSHGYLDNAASFDRIIPLLPKTFHYACVDLPGHGFSSRFFENLPSYYASYIMAYKTVAEHFNKKNYILLGHSLGAQFGLLFAQLYPKLVSKVISLDALYPVPLGAEIYIQHIRIHFEKLLGENEKNTSTNRRYTYDEAVEKVMNTRVYGSLTRETADDLVKRMIEKTTDRRYVFTVERRTPIMPAATHEFNVKLFNLVPVKCPVLILLTETNEYAKANYMLEDHFEKLGFIIKSIKGDHHVHQTAPEEVAGIITDFLLHKSKY